MTETYANKIFQNILHTQLS